MYYPKLCGGLAVMCLHVVLQVGLAAQPDRPGRVLVADYIPVRHLSSYIKPVYTSLYMVFILLYVQGIDGCSFHYAHQK